MIRVMVKRTEEYKEPRYKKHVSLNRGSQG